MVIQEVAALRLRIKQQCSRDSNLRVQLTFSKDTFLQDEVTESSPVVRIEVIDDCEKSTRASANVNDYLPLGKAEKISRLLSFRRTANEKISAIPWTW